METITGWLKFFGVIVGLLLLGFIFKWLGMLDWFDLIGEVILRAIMLGTIALIAGSLVSDDWRNERASAKRFRIIVIFVALFGAAAVMTFWEYLLPEF
jgi:uncharacterized membrane protein YeaQ/YmgE (transglycosylase-associated protein family)